MSCELQPAGQWQERTHNDKGKKDKNKYKKRKKRTKTIKDMKRTKTKPEIHHHPEILQLGTIGHPARGEHGSIIR